MTQRKLNADQVKYIVVHCAATPPSMDIGAKEIDRWHRERGYFRIGYHSVIRRDGMIEPGRRWDEIGAHAYGFNNKSVAVCLVGGVNDRGKPENNFTDKQWIALEAWVKMATLTYPNAVVVGHRDLPNVKKDCPSFDVKTWYEGIE